MVIRVSTFEYLFRVTPFIYLELNLLVLLQLLGIRHT